MAPFLKKNYSANYVMSSAIIWQHITKMEYLLDIHSQLSMVKSIRVINLNMTSTFFFEGTSTLFIVLNH